MDELFIRVQQTLRDLAQAHMQRERRDHTLQTTALINELYLRLVHHKTLDWRDRDHFVAIAARAMRHLLIDHARGRDRDKRGGQHARVALPDDLTLSVGHPADLPALDEALAEFESVNPEHARIVELRFFGGLSIEETARALGVSDSTVERGWRCARAWLFRRLSEEVPDARGAGDAS